MIEDEKPFEPIEPAEPTDSESVFLDSISQLTGEELKKSEEEQGLLRQRKIKNVYDVISNRFISDGRPVLDSYIRLDQEKRISDDLNAYGKVLIRGYWRIGKTSTALSVGKHYFGGNPLFLDPSTLVNEPLEKFKAWFGNTQVAGFIALKEMPTSNQVDQDEYQEQIINDISKSSDGPLVYLNEYLKSKSEKAYLVIDEIIGLVDQPDKMEYLTGLNLDHLKLAVVLHRIAKYEPYLLELFRDYKTHFVRSVTDDELGKLLSNPLADTQVSFDSQAQKDIYRFSGGRPMEVHAVAKTLTASTSKFFEAKKVYGPEQVEKITQARLNQLTYLESAIENYKLIFRHALSDAEKDLVIDAANGQNLTNADRQVVQPLLDTLVLVEDSVYGYRLNGDLFKKVIQETN